MRTEVSSTTRVAVADDDRVEVRSAGGVERRDVRPARAVELV
jgi:hypothetical protein